MTRARRLAATGLVLAALCGLAGCASGPERPRDAGRGDGSGRAAATTR